MELNHPPNKGLMEPSTIETKPEEIKKGRWQYQSNPWSKSEPPQWEFYSLEQNHLIEKAYYAQLKDVDLGDYMVSITHMIQKKKGAMIQQRPIRRINWEGDIQEIDRIARYFETELPKTMNKVFGNLGDFLLFFSRRNSEILDFSSQFEEVEKSNSLNDLHHKIIPKVVDCLEELVKPILEPLKDSSLSGPKKKIKKSHEELILLFKEESLSFEEFYGRVLRAYTLSTCLYEKLNNSLRNETWIEIDNLLPYAFCLCKAFFNLSLQTDSSKHLEAIKTEPENQEPRSIVLYRGTAFDEGALCFYMDAQTTQQHFSWNCVTSASTNVKVAERFMYENVDQINKKYPVLFIIEIPIPEDDSKSEYLKWIDVCQYSAKKEEDEVVLAPGSVFELVEVETGQAERITIKIKLRNEIKSLAQKGMMMQGTLQSQMMTEKEAKIMCLDGGELYQALMCLCGNKLIEEVEFCLCEFSNQLINTLFQILPTMKKLQRLKLISCKYKGKRGIVIERPNGEEECALIRIEISEMNELFQIFCSKSRNKVYWMSLRELDLDFRRRQSLNNRELNHMVSQKLKYFPQLISLNINLRKCIKITDDGVNYFAQSLGSLVQLTSLMLDFAECDQITDKAVESLAYQGLKYLTRLTTLALNFAFCIQITDEGVICLASQGLQSLHQLSSLDLNFATCANITNKGFVILTSEGLQHLSKLVSLALNFGFCRIKNEGVFSLTLEGLNYPAQLKSLNLDLSFSLITDTGLESLAFLLEECVQLANLTLVFHCLDSERITDKGVNCLMSEGLTNLTQLKSLALKFGGSFHITDEALNNFTPYLLEGFDELTSLTLDFSGCSQLTTKGFKGLMSQGFKKLTQLKYLALKFAACHQITEENIHSLARRWLKHLNIFRSLTINYQELKTRNNSSSRLRLAREGPDKLGFGNIQMIPETSLFLEKSEEDLSQDLFKSIVSMSSQKKKRTNAKDPAIIVSEILKKIQQSNSLILDSKDYQQRITNRTLHILISRVLKHLTQLKSLNLNFSECEKLTNEGLENFASNGLLNLINLTSLTLEFSLCTEIKEKGVISLFCNGLKDLSQLRSLSLNFEGGEITDDGMMNLARDGLRHVFQLATLKLNFSCNSAITDNGVMNLAKYGLRNLSQLTSLNLDFSLNEEITDEGVNGLVSKGLKNLILLESLTLNFSGCLGKTNLRLSQTTSKVIKNLTHLSSLALDFSDCEITDKGVTNLAQYGLNHLSQLTSLTSLNLNFSGNKILTERGVDGFVSKGLKNLTQLTSLTLDFAFCKKVSDKAMNNLVLQIVKNLSQLTFLDLNLEERTDVTAFTITNRNIAKVLHYFGFTKEIGEIDARPVWK